MSEQLAPCPLCASEYTYEAGTLLVCPMCGLVWPHGTNGQASDSEEASDVESVVKGLKVKGGGGGVVKAGTKVRGIRLVSGAVDDHDIDVKKIT